MDLSTIGRERRHVGPIPYRGRADRTGWKLPDGAQLAVWVIPNVEFFPLDQAVPGGAGGANNVFDFAPRDYGARAGFWRLLEVFNEFEVTATAATNSSVCFAYPDVAAAIEDAGWEVMGHGVTNSMRLSELSDELAAESVRVATSTLRPRFTKPVVGWLGPGFREVAGTPGLLAELEYKYVADWATDDRPNVLTDSGLISVPYSQTANDKACLEAWRLTTDEFADMVLREFEVLWREGSHEPRVLGFGLHPYISGVAGRVDAIRRLIGTMRERDGVYWCTGSEVADCYAESTRG